MAKLLVVYSIGPVQSMIASARKTEDLWSGSYLLSKIVDEAMKIVENTLGEESVDWIQPFQDSSNKKLDSDTANNPNRFLFFTEADQVDEFKTRLYQINQDIRKYFVELAIRSAKLMFKDDQLTSELINQIHEQTESYLEIFWSFTPMENETDFDKVRSQNESHLASVKNSRMGNLRVQNGLVCTVCHNEDALSAVTPSPEQSYAELQQNLYKLWRPIESKVEDGNSKIKNNERLCAVCTLKRMLRKLPEHQSFDRFPSVTSFTRNEIDFALDNETEIKYYALVMFDGDDMGKWVSNQHAASSGQASVDKLKEITKRLSRFATTGIEKSLEGLGNNVRVIYSGGDDVLAVGKISQLLKFVSNLRTNFSTEEFGLHPQATASCGIVIAPEKEPLQQVIQYARNAESMSKSFSSDHLGDKNAVTIHFLRGSGNQRLIRLPLTIDQTIKLPYEMKLKSNNLIDWLIDITHRMKKIDLGRSYIFQFQMSLSSLAESQLRQNKQLVFQNNDEIEIIYKELLRTISHTVHQPNAKTDIIEIVSELTNIYYIYQDNFGSFIQLLELIFYIGSLDSNRRDRE